MKKDGETQTDLATMLHARGERLTPQRLFVLEVLQERSGHQTAEAIFEQARIKYPYLNLATVYRTLTWLRDQGLVSETDLGGGQAEFEAIGTERHHHLVCLVCGGRVEFADDLVTPLVRALRERYGFEPRLDHLAVFGICRACQSQVPAEAS